MTPLFRAVPVYYVANPDGKGWDIISRDTQTTFYSECKTPADAIMKADNDGGKLYFTSPVLISPYLKRFRTAILYTDKPETPLKLDE